ncbi:hypothetical protein FB45DRAFT_911775 [Roridomyces roridus]|uniref:Zn(2)-C6 fungal-type domain-containing protein n=1 Tax=Roridomyces roridus TaxID=1738132 RepID=A0AAD7BVR2_9AGAR|nr:hypothetical protein FB45DRAFT_911775 [Roridomyces roridus]
MAPRVSSALPAPARNPPTRSVSAPYRRPTGQPKSSRQQYSACGACRMRRVRCDLKDLPVAGGPHPACSNCQERGLKCVDEFADVKAVKLLRRGRRLQQVEAIYGKGAGEDSSSLSLPLASRMPSKIPQLKPEFFSSPFWTWFSMQRPILDPTEFPARFVAHDKGTHLLGTEGKILVQLFVVWAASFGLDERGLAENQELSRPSSSSAPEEEAAHHFDQRANAEKNRADRKSRTEAMVQEILGLIDFHGLMRRPTWDGVRVLLLVLPLMEDISISSLDRRCMYEATLSQAALCALSGGPSMATHSFMHASDDTIIRARILWYAFMHEGMTTGMRGGRFVLTDEDIDAFQSTLPAFGFDGSSPNSPTFPHVSVPHRLIHPRTSHPQLATALHSYMTTADAFSIPVHLSAVCRRVYIVLTGTRAARRAQEGGGVDAEGMRHVWDGLEQCWEDLEALRQPGNLADDLNMFISSWQIFVFECHNIVRETLKQYSLQANGADPSLFSAAASPRSTSHAATYLPPQQLHSIASRKCLRLLPSILSIMRTHLTRRATLFGWDAGLVRDGCFFAGFLCASIDNGASEFAVENREFKHADMADVCSSLDIDEGVRLCLTVLKEMKWAFSKSDEREETVRRIWDDKKRHYDLDYPQYPEPSSSYSPFPSKWVHEVDAHSHMMLLERPVLPPLNLLSHNSPPRHIIDSAPSTGYSVDGSGSSGWPSYTPPGTGTSITSTSTGVSSGGSSVFGAEITAFKTESDSSNPFFHVTRDLDHFSFNPPMTSHVVVRDPECSPSYGSFHHVNGVFSVPDLAHKHDDMDRCPQFGENYSEYYH